MTPKKLAEKCRNCLFVDSCDHKQIEAVGHLPEPLIADAAVPASA